ncbi:MAG: hypothetical protein E6R13_03785 [Spirochaetes bacterium]|mgnify:CR=1 FL=1|nr:MAG: hypothetical protein E6R13_03785 [Spirochaetota bacterium]
MNEPKIVRVTIECPTCFKREHYDIKDNLLYGGGCKICDRITYGIWRTDRQCPHCKEMAIDGNFPIEVNKVNKVKCMDCKHL